MKKVALRISNICDIEIIEPRDNNIALCVLMDEKQITRNLWALSELKAEDQEDSELKMVK